MEGFSSLDVRRILLATDFSRWSTKAVDYCFHLARCFDAEVLMVHGIEPISDNAVDEDADDGAFDEFFGELVEKSRDSLEDLVSRAESQGVTARFHIEIGERWRIIVDCAEEEDADLVVLGRRAYKDHQDLSLGTTSQRVYFGTHRPVLTVPGPPEPVEADTSDDDSETSQEEE